MKRRDFVVAGSAAIVSAGLTVWSETRRGGASSQTATLIRDPKGVLDLREGFSYRVVQRTGERMSDGYRVPGRPDAMGCFELSPGKWALMRNHELDTGLHRLGPYHSDQRAPKAAYDREYMGGVSRVVLDKHGRVLSSNLVLAGTARNCAGGVSPWGWLTCEESVQPRHGYVFLCSTEAEQLRAPQRITAYGRFQHEAVAVDPRDHAAYLTEDRSDSCIYRFRPKSREKPFAAGQLQALAIENRPRFRLGDDQRIGARFAVRWVDVPASAGQKDELRYAAQERGAATLMRGEGIWRLQDGFAITSTTGGPHASGQVFHLAPTAEGGTLRVLTQSNDPRELDMPDNITVTPWGDLLVCEDNGHAAYLRLITQAGHVLPFAFNRGSRSEFAGVCFSPDGELLFVNIQEAGLTVAIKGPWRSLAKS
jgi:uncharacterized protein